MLLDTTVTYMYMTSEIAMPLTSDGETRRVKR